MAGKTCLLSRILHDTFESSYQNTLRKINSEVGEENNSHLTLEEGYSCVVDVDDVIYELRLTDTSGDAESYENVFYDEVLLFSTFIYSLVENFWSSGLLLLMLLYWFTTLHPTQASKTHERT